MSDLPDFPAPADETPAQHSVAVQKKKNIYKRITSGMPLLITVIVHVLLIGGAAAIVVQQAGGGKKKTFEAVNQTENANKQVEHRLQVARRGGASSASQSPVSANRIFSTAENALQMPAMPDLPSMGAGGFGGFGGMGSGVGMGAGSGMSTSLGGGTGLGGRGFMSLSFLGSTSQNATNVVFVVDTSTSIMAPAKGGFRAFSIIREEIMRLVGRLPPSSKFNVVLYRSTVGDENDTEVNLYQRELVPATSTNKKDFFEWMTPVNAQLNQYGPYSALRRTGWRRKPLPPEAGIDPLFLPPVWARATHSALEQQPDTVFVITASQGVVRRRVDEDTLTKRRAEAEKKRADFAAEMAKEGLDPNKVLAARRRAYEKAGAELAAANVKLVAAGKDPIVIEGNGTIFESSVQSAIKRAGITINRDTTGWTRKDGSLITDADPTVSTVEGDTWNNFNAHMGRLQRALLPERATLNIYLFVGPTEKAEQALTNLTAVAKRNGGSFQLLTTKRLEEIKAKEDAAAK
jgi:type II secretory pathway pseudopilin PulG